MEEYNAISDGSDISDDLPLFSSVEIVLKNLFGDDFTLSAASTSPAVTIASSSTTVQPGPRSTSPPTYYNHAPSRRYSFGLGVPPCHPDPTVESPHSLQLNFYPCWRHCSVQRTPAPPAARPNSGSIGKLTSAFLWHFRHLLSHLDTLLQLGRLDELADVVSEVKDRVWELMVGTHGNRLFQSTLASLCSYEQRTDLLTAAAIDPDLLLAMCCHDNGIRSILSLVRCSSKEQKFLVVDAMKPHIVTLAMSKNGSQILDHFLTFFSHQENKYIFEAIADHLVDVARSQPGSHIVQQYIGQSRGGMQDRILVETITNAFDLSLDPSGNYVVQRALQKDPLTAIAIVSCLETKFVRLSMDKYASNVVEKCLKTNGAKTIIQELLQSPYSLEVFENQFGNYVMKIAVSVAERETFEEIVGFAEKNKSALELHFFGSNVMRAIEKRRRRISCKHLRI